MSASAIPLLVLSSSVWFLGPRGGSPRAPQGTHQAAPLGGPAQTWHPHPGAAPATRATDDSFVQREGRFTQRGGYFPRPHRRVLGDPRAAVRRLRAPRAPVSTRTLSAAVLPRVRSLPAARMWDARGLQSGGSPVGRLSRLSSRLLILSRVMAAGSREGAPHRAPGSWAPDSVGKLCVSLSLCPSPSQCSRSQINK